MVFWWCFWGGVFVVVFLWWCSWVVFLWWRLCGVVVFLWWRGGVFVIVVVFLSLW